MDKTYIQTVVIIKPNAPFPVFGLEKCPLIPNWLKALRKADGSVIHRYSDRTQMLKEDGTFYVWYNKPTLAQAYLSGNSGNYYEFKSDGSVYNRYEGENYYWSPPVSCFAEVGKPIKVHECKLNYDLYFESDEECCEECLCCGEFISTNSYMRHFCSKECIKYYSENYCPV